MTKQIFETRFEANDDKNSLLIGLNERQQEAVQQTEGPLLVLAGAGSGKTRVLTCRIGYLIEQGVMPWQILAITFTNKAAGEMRERVDALLSARFGAEAGSGVFVSTFHSMCVRILRRDIERLGYARDFSIYDADDQRTLMRQVIKSLSLDTKMYRERAMLNLISGLKNEMRDWESYRDEASDYYERNVAKVYEAYQAALRKNNALDFDDLLLLVVELFQKCPEVLAGWQERFHYIMIDEYQDTNAVQFEIVRMLSARYKNLCVVGDDDQSIYKFRGADVGNILSFEQSFPGARVIKLEQNYRSTKRILNAANEVIAHNTGRKEKRLWTDNEEGELPKFQEYDTAGAEADAIVREASECGIPLKDQAVLYRTNAQSRLLEEKCIQRNVPYVIVGGVNFYQRKEIKDVLSYLRIISNDVDDLACTRILNVPKRGIGATSLARAQDYAAGQGISLYQALEQADKIPGIGAAAKKIKGFVDTIEALRRIDADQDRSLKELIIAVRDDTGYAEELKKEGEVETQTRMENIDELINKAVDYMEKTSEGERNLSGFLEDVALVADIDRTSDTDEVLKLMTLHAAKGLEFDKVYLCGMEDGLFPSSASILADDPDAEIEEERRLCYVGITRARRQLRMSAAKERMINGETRYEKISRFIDEIPEDCAVKRIKKPRAAKWEAYVDDYDNPIPKRGFAGGSNTFAGKYGGFGPVRQVKNAYSRMEEDPDPSIGMRKCPGASESESNVEVHGGWTETGIEKKHGAEDDAFSDSFSALASPDVHAQRVLGCFGSLDHSGTGREGFHKESRSGHTGTGASFGAPSKTRRQSGAAALSGITGLQKGFAKSDSAAALSYTVGDRVQHIKFGEGTVKEIEPGKTDYMVTVDFDEAGIKRMFAGFAKLKKC